MSRKKKIILVLLLCIAAAALIQRFFYIHGPSQGTVIFDDFAGNAFEEPLSKEEMIAVKKILWGKIPWPESLYGIPACGFGKSCSIILNDTRYMVAWDSCGTLCVENAFSDTGKSFYLNISGAEREIIDAIFDAHESGA